MYEALGLCQEGEGKNLIETAQWISNENGEALEQGRAQHSNGGGELYSTVLGKELVPVMGCKSRDHMKNQWLRWESLRFRYKRFGFKPRNSSSFEIFFYNVFIPQLQCIN